MRTLGEHLETAADNILNKLVNAVTERDALDQEARQKDAELRQLLEQLIPHIGQPLIRRALDVALREADHASLLAEYARETVDNGVPA